MRFLSWIALIPVAAVLVAFALNNRGMVSVDLWPAPYALDIPVYMVVFVAMVLGLALGAVWSWLVSTTSRARAAARKRARARAEAAAKAERETIDEAVAHPEPPASVPAQIETRP